MAKFISWNVNGLRACVGKGFLDFFKEIVSTHLGINFHSMQIVGSAKTGYSLSPKKVLQPFHNRDSGMDSSDIDIAVISERLYLHFWTLLRNTKDSINFSWVYQ